MIEIIFLKLTTNLIFNAETDYFDKNKTGKPTLYYYVFHVSVWNQLRGGIRQMGLIVSASLLIKPTEVGGFRSEARGAC